MNLLQRIAQQRQRLVTGVTTKGISHHPELEGRVHVYSSLNDSGGTSLEDYADYGRVYGVYPWVHKALSKITENVAGLPVVVVDEDDETVDAHPLTELFTNINDTQNPVDLWGDYILHKMLGGESFIQVVTGSRNNPVELWARRPDFMGVTPDESRKYYPSVLRYVYQEERTDEPLILEPAQCIHDRFPNPLSKWRGLAPISAVREGIVIDLFAQAWSKQFFRNSSRPDFAIVAPQGITQTERDAYLTEFSLRHRGVEGAHLPVILEQGVTDIKPFSFPPKDIEWLQQREFGRDEVGAIFGVPDEIMGYGRDTYENFQTAMEVFWTLTLLPLVMRRDVVLNTFFKRHYASLLRPGQKIQTDVSEVNVLQEDRGPKVDMAIKFMRMGVPFNTLNERLNLGIGDIEGGDVAYLDSQLIPLDKMNERFSQPSTSSTLAEPGEEPAEVERSAAWQVEAKQFRKWLRRHPEKDSNEFVARHLTDADKRAILAAVKEDTDAVEMRPFFHLS